MNSSAYWRAEGGLGRALWELSPAVAAKHLRLLPWRLAYREWPAPVREAVPGYTLLLPVPGDLPIFTRLAIANAVAQDASDQLEILVIPDRATQAVRSAFEACRLQFGAARLRLVEIAPPGSLLQRLAGASPSNNHWLQLYTGICAMGSTHALLHDADLFIADPSFMARHYRRCVEQDLSCLGVAPAWDTWMAAHGLDHVAATWELMLTAEWARSFAPWEHKQHQSWLAGEWHECDTCLATQARTAPDRCGVHEHGAELIHFNRVLGVYRTFQRDPTRPLEDHRFVLLLIRLLVDALPATPRGVPELRLDVPALDELVAGLSDGSRRVTYRSELAARQFPDFHDKLRRLVAGPLFDDQEAERLHERLAPFVAALGT